EERLLLDGIALHTGGVSPGHVERAAAVVADFADAGLAVGDGAAVSAGEAADAVVVELFAERGSGFADLGVEDVAERGHGSGSILRRRESLRMGLREVFASKPKSGRMPRCRKRPGLRAGPRGTVLPQALQLLLGQAEFVDILNLLLRGQDIKVRSKEESLDADSAHLLQQSSSCL